MKTIIIDVEKANARFESIMKSQAKCREHLHKLAGTIHSIKRLTGMMVVMFILTLSVNAQIARTNFIGKDFNEIKAAMNNYGMRIYNTRVNDNVLPRFSTFSVSFIYQYFGTLIYTFDNKNKCINYIIKSSVYHADLVMGLVYTEFPHKSGNNWTDGKYTATVIGSENILTVSVQ